jgi:hypothetical protein
MNDSSPFLIRHLSKTLFVITLSAVLSAALALGLYLYNFGGSDLSTSTHAWAEFGDYVGGTLSALFAFFALVALVVTLKVQAYEVHLSTEQLESSARALSEQSNHLAKQTFENTFFQMLKIHADIVAAMDIRSGGEVRASGRDSLKIYYSRVKNAVKKVERGDFTNVLDGARAVYAEEFNRYESDLGHYFRNLYRIFKFIDESNIEDKRAYTGIVRAQLSSDELALLFFNGLGEYGEKFRILIEKYCLLENLRQEHIPLCNELSVFYKESAFGIRNP